MDAPRCEETGESVLFSFIVSVVEEGQGGEWSLDGLGVAKPEPAEGEDSKKRRQ